jgi:hypothetical protein
MKKPADFNLTEEDVATALGLTREAVRQLRADELYLDEDFINEVGGRGICYAPSAIEKLRLILKESAAPGAKLGDIAILNVSPAAASSDQPTVILDAVVTKIYPHNPHFLEALLGGQTITVRVNNNANFIPEMIIPSKNLSMKNPRQYDFIGRCPRGRGTW